MSNKIIEKYKGKAKQLKYNLSAMYLAYKNCHKRKGIIWKSIGEKIPRCF
jgi:hypothetical protein